MHKFKSYRNAVPGLSMTAVLDKAMQQVLLLLLWQGTRSAFCAWSHNVFCLIENAPYAN